jgi:hypothetical protein
MSDIIPKRNSWNDQANHVNGINGCLSGCRRRNREVLL